MKFRNNIDMVEKIIIIAYNLFKRVWRNMDINIVLKSLNILSCFSVKTNKLGGFIWINLKIKSKYLSTI